MQTLKSSQAMADAMRGVTTAMKSMNTKLNLPSLQNILKEFERQNEKMEMTTEVMGDAIDDAFEGEDEEEETDELVNAVLDELGCNVGAELISAPAGKVGVAVESERAAPTAVLEGGSAEPATGDSGLDDDLQARLDALRK
jgi:charged multivesicular body protein 2A